MRYRLIKPSWGKDFIQGPQVMEGEYTEGYVLSKNKEGYNVYYFPNYNSNTPKGKFLSGKDVDTYQWIFVDMDLKDEVYSSKDEFLVKIAEFELEPSRVVDSGNGIHVYWRLEDLTRESFIELQFRLINHFDTDASVWTPLQLMRLPGSINSKNKNEFKTANLLVETDKRYTVQQLRDTLPQLSESQTVKLRNHLAKLDGVDEMVDLDALDSDELPSAFRDLLEGNNPLVRQLWYAEQGDRSDADWKLAHLLYNKKYNKLTEALPVLLNTKKALSKKNYRKQYAWDTINKVWEKESSCSAYSVSEIRKHRKRGNVGKRINGPAYFDATDSGWRSTELLGLIAGPGVGKTTATLDVFYEMIKNNPDNDDIYIFFTLEMQDWEIIDRWDKLIGNNTLFSDRFFVISNEDENNIARHLSLQDIFVAVEGTRERTGKNVAAIAIDHLGVVSSTIDVAKDPNFGITGDDIGFGTLRNISIQEMCKQLKNLAKMLDSFVIIQSQTTKGKAADGDTPLGADAAFGAAQFEWYCDYVLTVWQPLRRVSDQTDLKAMGWRYAKIRNTSDKDNIRAYQNKVLKVNGTTNKLGPLTHSEMQSFIELEEEASTLRKKAEKKEGLIYSNSEGFRKLKAIITQQNIKEG